MKRLKVVILDPNVKFSRFIVSVYRMNKTVGSNLEDLSRQNDVIHVKETVINQSSAYFHSFHRSR